MGARLEKLVPAHPKGVNVSAPDAISPSVKIAEAIDQELVFGVIE